MHGKIIQLSQEPIEKDDYKTSDDYLDTGFMQIADYTYDLNGTEREECIGKIAKDLRSGIEIKDGIFEIKDKKKFLTGDFEMFKRTIDRLRYVSLECFSGEKDPNTERFEDSLDILMYDLDSAYSDKFGYYIDIDDIPVPINEFLRNAHDGERYYIGAVIDYHC